MGPERRSTARPVLMRPRVLLCGRPDLWTKAGGDTRQIQALHRVLGPDARLSLSLTPSLEGIDLVHVFNLSRPFEPASQAAHARAAGVPVICTTIFQDLREYNRRGRYGAGRALFELLGRNDLYLEDLRAVSHLIRGGARDPARSLRSSLPLLTGPLLRRPSQIEVLRRRLLESTSALIFNSEMERDSVRRSFRDLRLPRRQALIPVGLEPGEFARLDGAAFRKRFGLEHFVLCVGRIEDLKNQLGLLRALAHDPLPLVLIGTENPLHRAYARTLKREVARRPATLLLHRLERPLVLSAMAAAAVHVLPSWFETCGLVSLEAAAAGCAVVSTDRGYARAYLGNHARYCDPADRQSIRTAVLEAYRQGPSSELRQRVLGELTHRRAAEALTRLYRQVCP